MMKKALSLVLSVILIAAVFSACSGNAASIGSKNIDVDLTQLSSTMVYSEVYNMMTTPDDYVGKTVKMQGTFSVYEDELTGERYYACLIADATACCQQGVEFVPQGKMNYPDDFPELDEEIVVVGTFEKYSEGELQYVHLVDSQLTKAS